MRIHHHCVECFCDFTRSNVNGTFSEDVSYPYLCPNCKDKLRQTNVLLDITEKGKRCVIKIDSYPPHNKYQDIEGNCDICGSFPCKHIQGVVPGW